MGAPPQPQFSMEKISQWSPCNIGTLFSSLLQDMHFKADAGEWLVANDPFHNGKRCMQRTFDLDGTAAFFGPIPAFFEDEARAPPACLPHPRARAS